MEYNSWTTTGATDLEGKSEDAEDVLQPYLIQQREDVENPLERPLNPARNDLSEPVLLVRFLAYCLELEPKPI